MDDELSYACPQCGQYIAIAEPNEGDFLVCLACCEVCRIHALANTRSHLGAMGELSCELVSATDLEIASWWRGIAADVRRKNDA